MGKTIAFVPLLHLAQEYISQNYAAALTEKSKFPQIKTYLEKYLRDNGYTVDGMSTTEVTNKLYSEMAEYSILTKYLGKDEIEEINVNGWDDVAITYTDGRIEKATEHFYSPQHAVDIIKRLLHHSGMIIDNAKPMSQGHLPGNTRITALKQPLVDDDRGISVSIRLLHPSRVNREQLVHGGNSTQKMIDFLCMCLQYGISFVVAGATSSGKTTLLNALLTSIPDNKRIFTIESGSRELSLLRVKDGKIVNNVVHTLSRPSDNEAYDITQEDLVVASLRFDPDIVVVGEMRDLEAYSVGNTLLVVAQKAEATQLRDFDGWKEAGASVKKGESAIMILEPGDKYTREDGSVGVSMNVKRVFDISQTSVKPQPEPQRPDDRTLLKALVSKSSVCIEPVDQMTDPSINAFYDPEQHTIYVQRGLEASELFKAVAKELAIAALASKVPEYSRRKEQFKAQCISYVLAGKFGVETKGMEIRVPASYASMNAQDIRAELTEIRDTACDMISRMSATLEQNKSARHKEQER